MTTNYYVLNAQAEEAAAQVEREMSSFMENKVLITENIRTFESELNKKWGEEIGTNIAVKVGEPICRKVADTVGVGVGAAVGAPLGLGGVVVGGVAGRVVTDFSCNAFFRGLGKTAVGEYLAKQEMKEMEQTRIQLSDEYAKSRDRALSKLAQGNQTPESLNYLRDQFNRNIEQQAYYPMLSEAKKAEINQERKSHRESVLKQDKEYRAFAQYNDKLDELNGKVKKNFAEILMEGPEKGAASTKTISENEAFFAAQGLKNLGMSDTDHKLVNKFIHQQKTYIDELKKLNEHHKIQVDRYKEQMEKEKALNHYRGLEMSFNVLQQIGVISNNKTVTTIGSVGASSVSIAFNVAALSGAIPGMTFTGWGLAIPYAGIALGLIGIASTLFGRKKKKNDPALKALRELSEQIEQLRKDLFKIHELLTEELREGFKSLTELNMKLSLLIKIMISDGFESLDFKMSDLQREIDRLNSLVTHGLQAGYLKDLIEAVDKVLLYVNVNGERTREIESYNMTLVVWMTNPNIIQNINGIWPLQACQKEGGPLSSANLRNHDDFLKTEAVHQLGYLAELSKQIMPFPFKKINAESIPNLSLFTQTLEAYMKARIHMGVTAAQQMDKNNLSLKKIKTVVENAQNWMDSLSTHRVLFMNILKHAYFATYRDIKTKLIEGSKNRLLAESILGFASQDRVQYNGQLPWPRVIKHVDGVAPDLDFSQARAALLDPANDPKKTFLINSFIESALMVGAGTLEAQYQYTDHPANSDCHDLTGWNFNMWVNSRGATYEVSIYYRINEITLKLFDLRMVLSRAQTLFYQANFKKNVATLDNASNHRRQVAQNQNNIKIEQHLLDSWKVAKFTSFKDSHRETFSDANNAQGTPLKEAIASVVSQNVIAGADKYPVVRNLIMQAIREHAPLLGDSPRDLESIKTLMLHYAKLLNLACVQDLNNLWGKDELLRKMNHYHDLLTLIAKLSFDEIGEVTPIQKHFNFSYGMIEYLESHEKTANLLLQQQESEAQERRNQVRNDLKIDPALVLDPNTINESELTPDNSLGSGSFGEVYHLKDKNLAVKLFHKGVSPDKSARTEIEVATRLSRSDDHCEYLIKIEGLTKVLGRGTAIVMEYVNGGNLYDALHEDENLPWEHCIRIAYEMAQGIKFLHDHKIIHRDLKSTNILLTDQYKVKISDYGLARVIGASQSMASQSRRSAQESLNLIGTPAYRAPEQCNNPGRMADEKSDIYALCLIIWEMLTRRLPFDDTDGNIFTIMNYWSAYKHLQGDNPVFKIEDAPRNATEVVIQTFTQLRDIVNQGLRMKPENRPTIEAVIEKTIPQMN